MKQDFVLLETMEEKHDTITKFVSYCLRLLNKFGYPDAKETTTYYHIIATLDKLIDIIKYAGRDLLEFKPVPKRETKLVLDSIHNCIEVYLDLFYKFDTKKVVIFTENRDKAIKLLNTNLKKISPEEVKVLTSLHQILELLVDLTEARMSLKH